MKKTKNAKPKNSRTLFLTLTRGDDHSKQIIGKVEEMDYIRDYYLAKYNTVDYMIGCFEEHKSEDLHIHFIVRLTRASFTKTNIIDDRIYFDNWLGSKTNKILLADENINKLIGYVCKQVTYNEQFVPYIYGNIEVSKCLKLGSLSNQYKNDIDKLLEAGDILESNIETVIEDNELLIIRKYMLQDGLYFNLKGGGLYTTNPKFIPRELNRLTYIPVSKLRDLYTEFEHPIRIQFSSKAIDHVIKNYHEGNVKQYPFWDPNLDVFQFRDGIYNYTSKEFIPNVKDFHAVRIFDCEYESSKERPDEYIEYLFQLFCLQSEVERFRKGLHLAFKKKDHRDKCLSINGIPQCGKGFVTLPWRRIFMWVLGEWAEDGSFSIGSIAPYPKVFANEVSPIREYNKVGDKVLKELMEGVEALAKIKHKQEKALIVLKNIIFVSNTLIREAYTSMHARAILERTEHFWCLGKIQVKNGDAEFINSDNMLARILYWVSQDEVSYEGFQDREYDKYPYGEDGELIKYNIHNTEEYVFVPPQYVYALNERSDER
jgi:hypothetical protein